MTSQAELERAYNIARGTMFRQLIPAGEHGDETLIRKYRIVRLYPHVVLTKTIGLKTNYNVCFQYWEMDRILGRARGDGRKHGR